MAAFAFSHPVTAQACGGQSDFLVRSDRLMAPVRPADCATVFQAPPDFTWPAQGGGSTYVVSLTFPDGHTETRSTSRNWLAWDQQVPAGRYTWKVVVTGPAGQSGAHRTFTVDTGASPAAEHVATTNSSHRDVVQ